MDIIPDKRKVIGLVENANTGRLCLPNFQRDFVWKRDEVADLLRSMLRRYYIGSLLLLRCDPRTPPFAPVVLRGARPEYAEPRPDLLILDGQQRLTSLLYAMTAPDLSLKDSRRRRWFFVDLNLLLNDPENDEIVFDRSDQELDGLEVPAEQYRRRIQPCTALLLPSGFLKWRDGLDDWLRDNDPAGHLQFRAEWRDKWTEAITAFQAFEVPLVELPTVSDDDHAAIGRVCAIFEKLNSTGVELSVYDLLTARLYRSQIRLHDLWHSACQEHSRVRAWSQGKADANKFGVLVLRTLALLRGLDPKPAFLINLKPQDFERDWKRAAAAIDRALELLELVGNDGFGVFSPKWLPGFGLLPVLAALRAEVEDRRLGETPRTDLRRWYWCNVFLERYSSAVESKSRKDYAETLAYWTAGGPPPSVFTEAEARIGARNYTIRDSASYASAVYSGVFCLLANRGARDWKLGEAIELQKLEDHHIFPKAYLKRHGYGSKQERTAVNSIVNRTLLSESTNRIIQDRAPADYLTDANVFPSGATESLMNPHFLSGGPRAAMDQAIAAGNDDAIKAAYERFQSAREADIVAEIRRVCGVAGDVGS